MPTWNSRGLRGSVLEDLINRTNEMYREKGLALIQKVPTPITPIKIDKEHRHITLAYFEQKSDIIGGVLVSKDETLMKRIREQERALYGGIIGPMEAWLVIRGIRTLPARLAMHQENAMKVASYLEQHPKVKQVFYTGLKSNPQRELIEKQQIGHTGLLSFIIDAPVEKVPFFIDQL